MVIDDYQKRYIESGLFNYDILNKSVLPGDRLMVMSIDKARKFFEKQGPQGQLQVLFIDNFYRKYPEVKDKMKRGMFHNVVCRDSGIEQAAGYVVRNEVVLRVALIAATEGLMKFE